MVPNRLVGLAVGLLCTMAVAPASGPLPPARQPAHPTRNALVSGSKPASTKFPTSHKEVRFLAPTPERVFSPAGLVAGNDGTLYILDSQTGLIKSFSARGKWTRSVRVAVPDPAGERHWTQALARGSEGCLLLAHHEDGVVRKFGPTGELLAAIPVAGKGKDHDYYTMRIASDRAANIYVAPVSAGSEQSVVKKFSREGRLLWQRSLGTSRQTLYQPHVGALAVDSLGRLWAWVGGLESDFSRFWGSLLVFDSRGRPRGRQIRHGHGDIVGAAFDARGNRYELWFDTPAGYGSDLLKFNRRGKQVWWRNWVAVEGTALAVDRRGHAFVTLRDFKFTAPVSIEVGEDGRELRAIGSNGTAQGQLRDPSGLALDSADKVYVGDYYNYRLQKFTSAGRFLGEVFGPTTSPREPYQVSFRDWWGPLCPVAVDSLGRIYVTHNAPDSLQQTVSVLSAVGRLIRKYSRLTLGYGGYTSAHFGASPRFPACVRLNSKGHLWTAIVLEPQYVEKDPKTGRPATTGGGIRVVKLDRSGKRLLSFGSCGSGPGQFGRPPVEGIGTALLAVDREDNVWVVDPGNNRVAKFAQDGKYLLEIGPVLATQVRLRTPWGAATDRQGHLYIADSEQILELGARGNFLGIVGYLHSDTPKLRHDPYVWPYRGIAADSRGNVYITDAAAESVRKFVPKRRTRRG